jgi:hypothetical protein
MPAARLRILEQLLDGFITKPEPGALVVACSDLEVFYLVHLLTRIDERSPADRFWIVADPFTGPRAYVDALITSLAPELPPPHSAPESSHTQNLHNAPESSHTQNPHGAPESSHTQNLHSAPESSHTPESRLHGVLEQLLATLPPGDHRLVCALTPAQIDDPEGFALLARTLLRPLTDPRLRVILREDRRNHPRDTGAFEIAAASTSEQLFAYDFSLPHELVTASVEATANDPARPPAERAPALLQIASRELGHGKLPSALARCELVATMPVDPALQALALALKADIFRQGHDLEAALSAGSLALEHAVAAGTLPVVVHAAMALGDLAEALGYPTDATTCFSLAERAAVFDPNLQTRARTRIDALKEHPC